jgi:hypothetical protein
MSNLHVCLKDSRGLFLSSTIMGENSPVVNSQRGRKDETCMMTRTSMGSLSSQRVRGMKP